MNKICFGYFSLLISIFVVSHASAHVVLDYPVGGESFVFGENIYIQWHISIPHDLENWDLYFSPDGGVNWEAIQLDLPPSQLRYRWTVPQIVSEEALIRIYMDNTGNDYDDTSAKFTIQEPSSTDPLCSEYPQKLALYPNYPNPFNPITSINYTLSSFSEVQLDVFNQLGQKVKSLVNKRQPAGIYQIQWDGRNDNGQIMSGGIYFCRLKTHNYLQTIKMLFMK